MSGQSHGDNMFDGLMNAGPFGGSLMMSQIDQSQQYQ